MVAEETVQPSAPAAPEPSPPEDSPGIEDSTQPDVLDLERRFEAGEDIEGVEPGEPEAEPGADAEPSQQAVTQAPEAPAETGVPPVEPETQTEPAQPAATRTEDEFRAYQSNVDRKAAEDRTLMQGQLTQLQTTQLQQNIESQVEAHRRNLQDQYTQQGVDPSQYSAAVEQQTGVLRESLQNRVQAESMQAQMAQVQTATKTSLMGQWVSQLTTDHSLTQEQSRSLQGMAQSAGALDETGYYTLGESMAQVATQLGGASKAQSEATAAKRAAVPAGGPSNQVESGGSSAVPVSDHDQAVQSARNKAAHEWNAAEQKAMQFQATGRSLGS